MDNVTLRQFRYFEALVRHGHFGRAAEASAISQPALSVQIKALETALGAALFERGPRGVVPTAFGHEVAPRVRSVLREVEALSDLARTARDVLGGRLRLGVIPTIAPYLMPRLVAALDAAYPDLDLDLRETITPRLIADVQEGRLDAALVALPVSEPSLAEAPLFDETFVLVRPEGDAGTPLPTPDALPLMRLLLLEEGHCFRDQALSFCDMRPTRPRTGMDGSSLSTLVQMVGARLGVTLIPEMAVAVETAAAPVTVDRFPDPQPTRTIGLVWRKGAALGDDLADLATVLRDLD
ncbi:LysR substrate-binding domain-containing protein [Jannaschia sp. KMU-145]|uniref:hydrogen peroxide-inducible genes activator n=1 Tax=Jannaschia halovivens TaxID=3388667 RepID=UPI00396B285E